MYSGWTLRNSGNSYHAPEKPSPEYITYLEKAVQIYREGLNLSAQGSLRNDFGLGYAFLAVIKQAQRDHPCALRCIRDALDIAEYADIPRVIHLIDALQARLWLAQGETKLAYQWAASYQLFDPTEYPREIEDHI